MPPIVAALLLSFHLARLSRWHREVEGLMQNIDVLVGEVGPREIVVCPFAPGASVR